MIRGERVIQINMALLILVGALLLSIAQDNSSVLLITAVGVTFSLVVVDWFRWISFHPFVVNTLAFIVSFSSFTQFLGGNTGTKLNAVASLLTYLQLVLLLQRKSPRLYWQIMMLSLLQVVVAAALNLDFSAGLVFFGYIILVVVGTIHLKIYRGNYYLTECEKRNDSSLEKLRSSEINSDTSGILTFRASKIDFRNEKKIAWQGFLLCMGSLIFSFAVFYSIPRFGSAWYGPGAGGNRQTGFAAEIRFDDLGFLQESNRNVFRASFVNDDDEPIELAVEPYFKGLILSDFMMDKAKTWTWTNISNEQPGQLQQGADILNRPANKNIAYVRQIIRLEPSGKVRLNSTDESHLLFAVIPAFLSEQTPDDLIYNPTNEIMFRDANLIGRSDHAPYHYEVLTPLYRNLGQIPAIPVSRTMNLFRLNQDLNRLLGKAFNRFDDEWKPIKELAGSVLNEVKGEKDRRIICNRLANYLKRPEFKYTRNLGGIKRNRNADPIVDFLTNHRSGHCEYYATALALMLRSQRIPCRIVTGYRGGDFNNLGGFYLVKEKHAHVWVEAYLRPQDCDPDMVKTGQASIHGSWLRLDPTPGGDETSISVTDSILDRAFDAVGFAQKMWDDYVTGLEQDSRTFNGFDPTNAENDFSQGAIGFFKQLFDRAVERLRSLRWWQWCLVVLVATVILLAVLYLRARSKLVKQGKNVTARKIFGQLVSQSIDTVSRFSSQVLHPGSQDQAIVSFFRDFQRSLKQAGFVRGQAETPREFGEKVADQLGEAYPEQSESIREAIKSVVDSFYSIRFGKEKSNRQLRQHAQAKVMWLQKFLATH